MNYLPRLAVSLLLAYPLWSLQAAAGKNWLTYLGDNASSHYSTLTQITRENVHQLKVAWTFDASKYPTKNRVLLECNPLIIDGVLYGTGANKMLFALDAATGAEIWHFDGYEITHGADAPSVNRSWPNRGLHYWTDGTAARLFLVTESLLCCLDAATGKLVPSFGQNGVIDLRKGLGRDDEELVYAVPTPGIVFENLIILGCRVPETLPSAPGHIRAFDTRTGAQVWRFNTIPHPGEFGYDTWPKNAYQTAGGANVWTGMALDEERGLIYCPTGSPAFDYYGADRIGQNLFGNSLLCLDVRTGQRRWHYQLVHHDLFDMDLPSPPNLFTWKQGGVEIPAVSILTKFGYVFVFNRLTGEPLFPIEEVPVPPSDMPGEQAWPTQPRPVKPLPYNRTQFSRDQITDISPESHQEILARYQTLVPHVPFLPLSATRDTIIFPGVWGGAEWGGGAMDPAGILYFNVNELPAIITLVDTSSASVGEGLYKRNCVGCHGLDARGGEAFGQLAPSLFGISGRKPAKEIRQIIREGKGTMPPFRQLAGIEVSQILQYLDSAPSPTGPAQPADNTPRGPMRYTHTGNKAWLDAKGYPAVKPPWGTLNAINLNTGEYVWKIPFGEHPELMAKGLPPTGRNNFGGPVITASRVLFIGASLDGYIRAYDADTGKELWRDKLPAGGYATPSVYEVNGKQYIVIACGGGRGTPEGDYYVAYALP